MYIYIYIYIYMYIYVYLCTYICIFIYRQLRLKLSYVLEMTEIKICREMKKTCFQRY